MAARAIAEREDAVARLEGDKAGLEKLLAEREKEQAQEIESLRRFKLEEEIIDAEYTLTCDRIVSLKDKLIWKVLRVADPTIGSSSIKRPLVTEAAAFMVMRSLPEKPSKALMVVCEWELGEARKRDALDRARVHELEDMHGQIESQMSSGTAKVVEYWEAILKRLHIYKAKGSSLRQAVELWQKLGCSRWMWIQDSY
uniref:Splicing factor cactin central domain-containing protein n=2 Tax=Zea mays TaxID=4577 RepID=A0A804QR41_MAIZE